jgi:uncharacterized protein
MSTGRAQFRLHGDLVGLLRTPERDQLLLCRADGTSTVKHLVEELGVPHTEYDEVRVNGALANDDHQVGDGDVVDVYAARPRDFDREPRFLLDVHLGKLARYLRLLGLDAAYESEAADDELVRLAATEGRTLLTQDRGLLRRRAVTNGRFVRGANPQEQLLDVVQRFRLLTWIRPLTRCTICNGRLVRVPKSKVLHLIQPGTQRCYDTFATCEACSQVYWQGAHYRRIADLIELARSAG